MSNENERLKILSVVSEVVPFIATGGMGQVAGALSSALAETDSQLDLRTVVPLYEQFRCKYESQMKFLGEVPVKLAWRGIMFKIYELAHQGVIYYFVDNSHYFGRENAYGYYDDGERFALFSKAVFAVLELTGFVPDVIHAHDWQTALVPVYLKTRYADKYGSIRTVFTIHNLEYQGVYARDTLTDVFDLYEEEAGLVLYNNDVNLMKGAIVCADKITTVSPSYAEEIKSGGGYGLDAMLRENSYKLTGIINGIDTKVNNPETDPMISMNYTVDNLELKAINKEKLQALFGLPQSPRSMLICVVSRLVSHKGIDLITYIMDDMLKQDVQFLLLGTGDHEFQLYFEEKAVTNRDKVGVSIAYNPEIASKIYAGADAMLMPSRSEPCGLAQMIACRYGTIPIVRKTGGLGDTIKDCRLGVGNGFVFEEYSGAALMKTINKALDLYTNREDDWKNLMREAMNSDFGWDISAKAYASLYRELK
ncbi:MAG: glycogen synthase [Oscillospiraceae bacterium]|nr:glycogen synthase [Oscillospiraceae bacterium]